MDPRTGWAHWIGGDLNGQGPAKMYWNLRPVRLRFIFVLMLA